MKVFNLPDLGEGLPDAEIVEWLVSEGDEVDIDQPLVSMETAKAVVEVPSPFEGRVVKFHGGPGDVIQTGAPLAEFEVAGEADEPAEAEDSAAEQATSDERESAPGADSQDEPDFEEIEIDDGDFDRDIDTPAESASEQQETSAAQEPQPHLHDEDESPEPGEEKDESDSGTVVGSVQSSGEVLTERTSQIGGVKVTPAVRALARKLRVDLTRVEPSGADGVVTAADVRQAAPSQQAGSGPEPRGNEQAASSAASAESPARSASREDSGTATPAPSAADGDWQPLRGTRRTMARAMSESHARVVPTTLMDDADIQAWRSGEDVTYRLLRSLAAGARAEPGLNAWFDDEQNMRMVHKGMDVGMAVDTGDGLFVARLRGVDKGSREDVRAEINRLKDNVRNRSIPPEDLKDYTIMLSNFGVFAGRYATPIINPPCVAIVAAGVVRHEVVPVLGGIEVHRMIPLSLTFDHRTVTGGEAARFLRAMLDDLSQAE
ncbi:MAG: 2-oxo acid dehydrogenase subunit E2 [Pseudomonadota bacterium]|nr:MAG: 2-oxo acid dehydrogenase subunit E2 [Pseudomonadota bacterium]